MLSIKITLSKLVSSQVLIQLLFVSESIQTPPMEIEGVLLWTPAPHPSGNSILA